MAAKRRFGLVLLAMAIMVVASCRVEDATKVVDGDTIDVTSGRIRFLGIDTPERGKCGFYEAAAVVQSLIDRSGGKVVLIGDGERDRYDRELAYVHADGVDVGEVLLRYGLAVARYDSRDGYGWHDREDYYHSIDDRVPQFCGSGAPNPTPTPSPTPTTPPAGAYYANCTEARAAGAAPIYIGQPGYRPALDRDGDGVACET